MDNPRGVTVDGGFAYVADAGRPALPYSGRIIKVDSMGKVTSLPAQFGGFVADVFGERYFFGLSDVASSSSDLYVLMGLGAWLQDPLYAENRLISISPDGSITELFDVGDFERTSDPDGTGIDANATGLAIGKDGKIWISDAAGNWVAQLTTGGSRALVELTTVFPAVDGEDAVPTGITVGPDGNAYVALFRCQQPTTGKGGIAQVQPNGAYEIVVTGLSNPIDVAFDADGHMYVLEFAVDYAPETGRLLAVQDDGDVDIVLEELTFPTSLAISDQGDVYITEVSSPAGGPAGSGRLLIFDSLIAEATE